MATFRRSLLLPVLAGLALAGCGGGGGGGGAGGPVDNSWLSFSPATTELTTYAGESTVFRITATSSKTISGVVNVGIVDARGVVERMVSLSSPSALVYVVDLQTAATTAAGDYSGNLEVRLCRDTPTVCSQPVEGSPWQVPYRIKVQAATNLSTLAPLAGAPAWTTYQGNAAHTGYVAATVQPSAFNRRWALPLAAGSMAVEGGRVFVTPPEGQLGQIRALSEADGSEQWRFGDNRFFTGVASGGGRVWFMHEDIFGNFKTLQGLDAATGQAQASAELSAFSRGPRLAPVVIDGSVFFASDDSSTITRSDAGSAATQWRTFFGASKPANRWSPAVGGGRALVFDYHRLWLADAATGAVQGSIDGPNVADGISGIWEVSGAPVIGSGSLVYVSAYYTGGGIADDSGRLVAFNVDSRTVAWNVGTTVRSNPVLVGNVVYVSVTGGALQAHDAATGALLWRWDAPAGAASTNARPNQPLIVVGNHAFIGLAGTTHAIDLGTRQSVWTYPASGPMAVSANGTLFIAGSGRLHAINLR